jgi:hypothetical protein
MALTSSHFFVSFVIVKKLPKETNRPIGENSPNLVTLSDPHCGMANSVWAWHCNWISQVQILLGNDWGRYE